MNNLYCRSNTPRDYCIEEFLEIIVKWGDHARQMVNLIDLEPWEDHNVAVFFVTQGGIRMGGDLNRWVSPVIRKDGLQMIKYNQVQHKEYFTDVVKMFKQTLAPPARDTTRISKNARIDNALRSSIRNACWVKIMLFNYPMI